MKVHIHTNLNGEATEFLCESQTTLLSALRDTLHMTGTKEGCGSGDCGACSVLLDGRLVCACLVLAAETEGRAVQTIEGVAGEWKARASVDGRADTEDGSLHPLQSAFLRHGALQCGICTPGLIMAAKALLEQNPAPDEQEIRFWIAGNLCRCTGYDKIVRAIADAAAVLAAQPAASTGESA